MKSAAALQAQEDLVELLMLAHDDPAFFIETMLHPPEFCREPSQQLGPRWKWQRRVCNQIRDRLRAGDRHLEVLIRSCHGAGKTWLAAALTLWWTVTRQYARTLTLAQTWAGVESHIWPNIATLYGHSLVRSPEFEMLNTEFQLDRPPSGGKSKWYAIGASSDRPERLEGHHSPTAAMRVIDEAKAVDKGVFTSTQGMLDAPETLDLWISTPSIQTGEFYDRDMKSDEDGPPVIRCAIDVDQLIADGVEEKVAWKEMALREWGEGSPEYESRAMARYIDNAEGALYPASWIERAMAQPWSVARPLAAGFDVAGSVDGDENALAVAAGPDTFDHIEVKSVDSWKQRDTMISKGRVISILRPLGSPPVAVDIAGLGKGPADALRYDAITVSEYRSADPPNDPSTYENRKAEDGFHIRNLLEKGLLKLPRSQRLKAQATAIRYEVRINGKKRTVDPPDSPDLWDAVLIACANTRRSNVFFEVGGGDDRLSSPSDFRAF